jgi:hypothetical protein
LDLRSRFPAVNSRSAVTNAPGTFGLLGESSSTHRRNIQRVLFYQQQNATYSTTMVDSDGQHMAIDRDFTNTGQESGVIRKTRREINVVHDFT